MAGLATAVRLRLLGYEVDVYEAADGPGGKLSQFELGGYRFDAGPSLFTMPQYVEELFEAAGERTEDYFTYERLPVVCHYFWEDGTTLDAHADPEQFAQAVEEQLGEPAAHVRKMLRRGEKKYRLTGRTFLEKSLHRRSTWLTGAVAKAMLNLPTLQVLTDMHTAHERAFDNPKVVQLFDRFATYNGSNPYKASAMLTMIPHFEHGMGAYLPKGGMYAITESIYELGRRHGVRYHFGTRVDEILTEQDTAIGLRIGNSAHDYDTIVSNVDVYFTYKHLLPEEEHPERILNREKSTSALIFYLGVRRPFEELGVHNIFFSDDYKAEFEALARGEVSDDPTVYINITSKGDPDDAPEGGENWFVMVNVPHNSGQDWDALTERIRSQMLAKVSRVLGVDVARFIEVEDTLDPRSIEQRTGSHLGALYGSSSNDRMSAFMRHPNFNNRISNLYFCGGSVHPGGGIPLCLLSARITAEEVARAR